MQRLPLAFAAALLLSGGFASAQDAPPAPQPVAATQVHDDLFAGTEKFAAGASKVSEVNMDPNTLQAMGGVGKDAAMAKKMSFIVVRDYTYDRPGMYQMADVLPYRQKLMNNSWSCMVHTQSKDKLTDVCQRLSPDHETTEMAVITATPTKLSFIHMKGQMSLAEMQDMDDDDKSAKKDLKPRN